MGRAPILVVLIAIAGCSSADRVEDPATDDLVRLAERASAGDKSVAPELIARLDAEDPGERAFAYGALQVLLQAIWGRRAEFGYRPWAPRQERLERIAEIELFWRRWKVEIEARE